jgi:hypothetical protein
VFHDLNGLSGCVGVGLSVVARIARSRRLRGRFSAALQPARRRRPMKRPRTPVTIPTSPPAGSVRWGRAARTCPPRRSSARARRSGGASCHGAGRSRPANRRRARRELRARKKTRIRCRGDDSRDETGPPARACDYFRASTWDSRSRAALTYAFVSSRVARACAATTSLIQSTSVALAISSYESTALRTPLS